MTTASMSGSKKRPGPQHGPTVACDVRDGLLDQWADALEVWRPDAFAVRLTLELRDELQRHVMEHGCGVLQV